MANQEKFFVEFGVDTDSTSSFKVPAGTTAQRDASPESGLFRYNTSTNQFEGYSNGSWGEIGGSSLGQSFDVDTFTGDNSTTAFTLSRSVSSEDYLIVFIDGVFQGQSSYVLSGTTLTLDSAPATGSSIIAYSVVPISVAEIPADTDDLTEGSTNLYFTNARVDSRLSSGSVSTIETSGNVTVGGDLSVSGGLTVSGTTTTVNSTTTSVTDSMIELANSNTSSDVIDIGIYGNYDDGLSEGGVSEYTGLFRDASDSTWKLFDGLEEEPSTTVNISGTNYAKAALEVGDLDATTLTIDTDTLVVDATNDRVGIGISTPTTELDVRGEIKSVQSGGTSFATTGVVSDMSGGAYITVADSQNVVDNILAGIQFSAFNGDSVIAGTYDSTNNSSIVFGTETSGTITEKMRINSSGKVGIGAVPIQAELHVVDSLTGNNSNISASSPTVGLFERNGDAEITILGNAANHTSINFSDDTHSAGEIRYVHGSGTDEMRFYTASTQRAVIDSSGKVGIGTSSPSSKLHVYDGSVMDVTIEANPPELNLKDTGGTADKRTARLTVNDNLLKIDRVNDADDTATNLMAFDLADSTSNYPYVGIGTTDPIYNLHVRGSGGNEGTFGVQSDGYSLFRIIANNDANLWFQGGTSTATSQAQINMSGMNGSNRTMVIDTANQRVLVGPNATSITPEGTFTIQDNIGGSQQMTGLALKHYASADDQKAAMTCDIDFYLWDSNTQNSVPQARVGATGDDTGSQDDESGGRLSFYVCTPSVTSPVLTKRGEFIAEQGGDFYTNDGTVSSLSDERIKTNINSLSDGLDIVNQLRPVTYEYNNTSDGDVIGLGDKDDVLRYGFIAQEVQAVAPQYVSEGTGYIHGEKVNDFKSISMMRMIPMLTKSIQELSEKLDSAEARIAELENR